MEKDGKYEVSFNPDIKYDVREGNPIAMIDELGRKVTVLVAAEIPSRPELGARVLVEDGHHHSRSDINEQAEEWFKGKIIDPRKFELSNLLWAMEVLNKAARKETTNYQWFDLDELTEWKNWAPHINGPLAIHYEHHGYRLVGAIRNNPYARIELLADSNFCSSNARLRSINVVYERTDISDEIEIDKTLEATIREMVKEDIAAGHLAEGTRSSVKITHPKERTIRISWSSTIDNQEVVPTYEEIYERKIPQSIGFVGMLVEKFFQNNWSRQIAATKRDMRTIPPELQQAYEDYKGSAEVPKVPEDYTDFSRAAEVPEASE